MASDGNVAKSQFTKVGPCGGNAGVLKDMNPDEVKRVVKIIVTVKASGSSTFINGFTVHYERNDGMALVIPYGASGGTQADEINLEGSQYITNVSGTVGSFDYIVTSLTFQTNTGKSYGPYGTARGNRFDLITINGDSIRGEIIGFIAYSKDAVNGIGAYVKATANDNNSDVNPTIVTMGPSGGNSGTEVKMDPNGITRFVKLGVSASTSIINALTVYYQRDESGPVESVTWGRISGPISEVTFDPSETITKIKGTAGGIGYYLTSLTIETNKGTSKQFGTKNGNEFEFPAINTTHISSEIVSFHARTSGTTLTGLGVYGKVTKVAVVKPVILKLGPCGGSEGESLDMDPNGVTRIIKASIWYADDRVFAISVHYQRNGVVQPPFELGVITGTQAPELVLGPSEYITSIEGSIGLVRNIDLPEREHTIVTSLTIKTNEGQKYGPYGGSEGAPFELHAPNTETIKGEIVGFHGRKFGALDAIGVYTKVSSKTGGV